MVYKKMYRTCIPYKNTRFLLYTLPLGPRQLKYRR